ncbi:MAG: hypothetical protein QXD26_04470 [Nitrososphaerota archaeon]
MSMALDDWLLEGDAVRFSAYDYYQKSEIVVTDRRLIFCRSRHNERGDRGIQPQPDSRM